MSKTIRSRDEIPAKYKWNAASVYPSDEAWDSAADALLAKLEEGKKLVGKVGKSAKKVADALDLSSAIQEELGKLATYAVISQAVDNADQSAARIYGKIQSVYGQAFAGLSFIEPEILAIDRKQLNKWRKEEKRLKPYAQYFDNLLRQQAHVRSAEVEEVFGLALDPLGTLSTNMNLMTNSEMHYPNAQTSDGKELTVTQGSLDEILASPD
ncbi:MAG TPA: hypothetical protein VFQ23_13645, partial [Anaerolineales bacterium]|nr:hypothetical protein [Anaerolineales bacterium]